MDMCQVPCALAQSFFPEDPHHGHTLFPAYSGGDRVEYFSATQEKWLLGEVNVQPVRGKMPFVYSVTLHRLAQELLHVEPELLRLPFSAGEPCEIWCFDEQHWIEGEVLCMEAGSTPIRRYKVQPQGGDPVVLEASMLRRCFPEGSQVRVYQGATHGFCHARVAGVRCESCSGQWTAAQSQQAILRRSQPPAKGRQGILVQTCAVTLAARLVGSRRVQHIFRNAKGSKGSDAPRTEPQKQNHRCFSTRTRCCDIQFCLNEEKNYTGDDWLFGMREALGGKERQLQVEAQTLAEKVAAAERRQAELSEHLNGAEDRSEQIENKEKH
eukprot:g25888.t1